MKNITLAIDESLLERARALALKRHTSLNAIVRALLADEVEQDIRLADSKKRLADLIENSTGQLGSDYKWNREEIYAEREDRLLSRHQHPGLRSDRKDR